MTPSTSPLKETSFARRSLAAGWLLAFFALACSSESPPASTEPAVADEYLSALPSWTEFSPKLPSLRPAPAGATEILPPEKIDVRTIGDDGVVQVVPDVDYHCTQTPYSVQDTPDKLVMYSPDVEILWPGALLQGKTHRDGLGSLLGLPIAQRSPVRISIPALPTGDNFRELNSPNQATAAAAIGEMIGAATITALPTPSDITFEMRTSSEEKEFALSLGISGNYLKFSGSASGDFSKNASETTVTAHFLQKMFEVVVEPPQTPGAFFSPEFTQDKLDEQIALGKIGPNNLPVYVSNIVYGRMMTFSFTSTASEQEIRGTLEAAYKVVVAGVSVNLTVKQKKILSEAKIAVTSLGGDGQATLDLIRSGDWREYFSKDAPLSSAAPLSYTFRNLADGSIAAVTETAKYNVKQCKAVAGTSCAQIGCGPGQTCENNQCKSEPSGSGVGCVHDGVCTTKDDCVCSDCETNSVCSKNLCDNDGVCNAFIESCLCGDCLAHPECQ